MHNTTRQKAKLNNQGAALVTVLVVTTFITLLATTMMYSTAMNYQQKLTDYQNKDSFYQAEQALDELKSLMVEDVQTAYMTAYNNTMRRFVMLGSATARQEYFQDEFNTELTKIWDKHYADAGNDLTAAVQAVMNAAGGEYAADKMCIYKVADYGLYKTTSSDSSKTYMKFVLRGVRSKYTSGTYTTFIYTDICIEPPTLSWTDSCLEFSATEAIEHEAILLTDYVSYINWRKADYDDDQSGAYDSIDIGSKDSGTTSSEETSSETESSEAESSE